MKFLKVFGKVTDYATRVFAYVAAAALVFNVVIVLINVILRAFGSSVIGVEEYISMAEVVVIFLGLGYVQYNKGLVHVCFFMKKIPGKVGPMISWAVCHWVSVAVIAVLAWQTLERIPLAKQATTSLLIPYKPFYVVILIGCILYGLAQLFEATKATIAIFNKDVREVVMAELPA